MSLLDDIFTSNIKKKKSRKNFIILVVSRNVKHFDVHVDNTDLFQKPLICTVDFFQFQDLFNLILRVL